MPNLRLVMSEVERHVRERILRVLGLLQQLRYRLAKEALVLRLGVELLAGHLDDIHGGVVAHAGELDKLVALGRGKVHIGGAEFDDDLVGGGVGLAEVGGVAEAEGGRCCGVFEGAGEV